MRFKKVLAGLFVSLVLMSTLTVTAYAGGHHGGAKPTHSGTGSSAVCPRQNCTRKGTHAHNGRTYCEHSAKDGHNYHNPVCPSKTCTRTGNHTHGGKTYSGHSRKDGHRYHR